ncbi:MAG: hypothetical protein ACJAV6_000676 [Candidatus Paceibacteria bacterium]|jgi:hypothetical protein
MKILKAFLHFIFYSKTVRHGRSVRGYDGKLLEFITVNDENENKIQDIHFNEDGSIRSVTTFNADGSTQSITDFYDEGGRPSHVQQFDPHSGNNELRCIIAWQRWGEVRYAHDSDKGIDVEDNNGSSRRKVS